MVLALISQQLGDDPDVLDAAQLVGERLARTNERQELRTELAAERALIAADQATGTDPRTVLRNAIVDRERTLTADVIAERPAWLCRWLTELHTAGHLGQLTDTAVVQGIGRIAAYRDRWAVDVEDTLGHEPAAATAQHREWQQLVRSMADRTTSPRLTLSRILDRSVRAQLLRSRPRSLFQM